MRLKGEGGGPADDIESSFEGEEEEESQSSYVNKLGGHENTTEVVLVNIISIGNS